MKTQGVLVRPVKKDSFWPKFGCRANFSSANHTVVFDESAMYDTSFSFKFLTECKERRTDEMPEKNSPLKVALNSFRMVVRDCFLKKKETWGKTSGWESLLLIRTKSTGMIAKCWILCLYEYMKSVLNCKFRIHNSGWKIPRMTGNQLEFTLTETHVSHGIQYCGNMSRKDLLNFLYCLLLERMFQRIIWNISQHLGKFVKNGIEHGWILQFLEVFPPHILAISRVPRHSF